jgi:transketolase
MESEVWQHALSVGGNLTAGGLAIYVMRVIWVWHKTREIYWANRVAEVEKKSYEQAKEIQTYWEERYDFQDKKATEEINAEREFFRDELSAKNHQINELMGTSGKMFKTINNQLLTEKKSIEKEQQNIAKNGNGNE